MPRTLAHSSRDGNALPVNCKPALGEQLSRKAMGSWFQKQLFLGKPGLPQSAPTAQALTGALRAGFLGKLLDAVYALQKASFSFGSPKTGYILDYVDGAM